MDAKMSYKSKRLAIIVAVIVILIAAISVGTYYFIQGNDDTQAAYTGDEQVANNGDSETAGSEDEQTNPADEQDEEGEVNQGEEDSQEPTNIDDNTDNDTTTDDTADDTTDDTTPGTTTNTGDNDTDTPNEEYTQTDIIETEVERVEQEVRVGWSNIALASAGISTNIPTNKPDLTLEKTATVVNSANEADNTVQVGSKIRYDITVTNNNTDTIEVNVSDIIPNGTKFDTEAGATNGVTPDENGRLLWVVEVPGKVSDTDTNNKVTLSFTVEVIDTEAGEDVVNEIRNVAVVNGKNTNETVNPILETRKTATSTSEVLEEGSVVTYTIEVSNTGTTDAITTISDTVPVETSFVAESIKINGESHYTINEEIIDLTTKTAEDLANGFVVSVPAGETVELQFNVTINEFYGESIEISNTAVVGDKETNKEDVIAYNPVMNLIKDAEPDVVEEGEKITYTLTVTNTGKVDGIATIKDSKPAGTDFVEGSIKVNGESSYTLNGVTVDLTTKTANDLANGIQVNVAENGGTTTLSFEVRVIENSGLTDSIKNTAHLVGKNEDGTPTDIPTNETETEVKAYIVFIENGGTEVNDIKGYAGDEITDTTMPTTTKTGYTFEGWYADEELTIGVDKLPENMVAGTTYYYAKWNVNAQTYTVNYLEKGTNNVLAEAETKDTVYGSVITGADEKIDIEGYSYDSVDPVTLTIGTDNSLNVINVYYTQNPLTLTKTALDGDKNTITNTNGYVYKENETNYMYYRLTVKNNGPEAVEEQIITDTLPYGMTYIDEGNTNISQETVEEQGKNKTRITWTIDGIEAYGSATVDIKVQIDERVFEGVDQVEDSEYNVISEITAVSPQNTDREYQTTDTTGKKMSLFVRFASPVSGNSGYLYAGTTTAADSGMPTANNDLYVQKYNGTGRYTDGEIDGNLGNAQALANMLDDFYKANTDGTIASYVDNNVLPDEDEIKTFLETQYNITLDSSHTILWYKVSERANETARIRQYDITNKETGASYTTYVNMSECTYHLDGIIVDINSFNKIPDGSDIAVQNTAYVRTVDKSNWLNTEASADVTIYYNARPVNINLTTDRLTRLSETTDANNVEYKIKAINDAPVGNQEETEELNATDEIIEDGNKEESGTIGSGNATEQLESSEGDNATGQLESPEEGNTTEADVVQTTPIDSEDMIKDSELVDESATDAEALGENFIQNEKIDYNYEIKDEEATDSEAQEKEQSEKNQSAQEEILDE